MYLESLFSESLFPFLSQNSVLLYCETGRYWILLSPSYLFLVKMFIGSPRPGTWNLLLLLSPLQLLESQVYVKSDFSHSASERADSDWSSVVSFCFAFELILLNHPLIFFSFLISEKAFVLSQHLISKDHSILNNLKWINESTENQGAVGTQPGQLREFCWSIHQICSKSKSRAWFSLLGFFGLLPFFFFFFSQ